MRRATTGLALLAVACGPKTPEAAPPPAAADQNPVQAPVAEPPGAGGIMATFTCPDSTVIYAIFRTDSTGKGEVSLAIGEERLRLPQAVSASGARYADSAATFWNKGKEATFTRGGASRVCVTP